MLNFLCFLVSSNKPITEFLLGPGPCNVCNSVGNEIQRNVNNLTKFELKDNALKYCQKLDKNEAAACSIIVKSHFDMFYQTRNNAETCSYLCNKDEKKRKRPRIGIINSERRQEALSMLDCNICEMVVGFALEQGKIMATSNAGKIFREQCADIQLYRDHCKIFTDEVALKMINHLVQNAHPFEMCTFFGYCP